MLILPAVDLKNGKCVRLLQGKRNQETVYSDDPVEVALRWQGEGARYLHLVDLDGAFEGMLKNVEVVKKILEAVDIPMELGGGIRDLGTITRLLSLGLDRVILGTMAVSDPELIKRAVQRFGPERIVVGIDVESGKVAVRAWEELSEISAVDLALQMRKVGVRRIVYTDIVRDGMMVGPNIEAAKRLAQESGLKIIVSGGISSIEDIMRVAQLERFGVDGVIVGKALYEGKVSLKEAVRVLSE